MNKEWLNSEIARKSLANFLGSIIMLIIIIIFDNVIFGLAAAFMSSPILYFIIEYIYFKHTNNKKRDDI